MKYIKAMQSREKSGETVYLPGVFMMVVPVETVEDTLNEHYSFVTREILLLIMAIAILRTETGRASAKLGIAYIDCGTSGGVYGLWILSHGWWRKVCSRCLPSPL